LAQAILAQEILHHVISWARNSWQQRDRRNPTFVIVLFMVDPLPSTLPSESSFAEWATVELVQLSLRLRSIEDVSQQCDAARVFLLMLAGILAIVILVWVISRVAYYIDPANTSEGLTQPARPVHIGALDGLRGIFAVLIIVYHQNLDMQNYSFSHIFDARALMQFFFVVSGFVNVKAVEKQHDRFDWKGGLLFIRKRIVKLMPLYWFAMWLLAITYSLQRDFKQFCHAEHWFVHSIAAQTIPYKLCLLTVTQNSQVGGPPHPNVPNWFVSNLLILNVFFPVLYNMCPSRRAVISCLIPLILVVRSCPLYLGESLHTNMFIKYVSPFTRLPEFFVGMLSAVWCRQLPSHAASWSGWGCIFDVSITVALVLIIVISSKSLLHNGTGDYGLTGIFCITCISACASVEAPLDDTPPTKWCWPRPGLLGSILNLWPVQRLAGYAWAIYVMQVPVALICRSLLPEFWYAHVVHLVSILAGILADVIIDQPIQRFLSRIMRDSPSPSAKGRDPGTK